MPFTHPDQLPGGRNMAAFLDMLAFGEGTDNGRQPTRDHGYDVLVGGGLFVGYADHPRQLIRLPRLGISSTAAGRYQLLARYYDAYKKQLGLSDFSPDSQDQIAVQQIRERGAIPDIEAGRIEEAVYKRHESHGGEPARKTKALAAANSPGLSCFHPLDRTRSRT